MFEFDYAIQRADGKFYNGRANVPWNRMFTDIRSEVYTYSRVGAERKMRTVFAFAGSCKIVKVS